MTGPTDRDQATRDRLADRIAMWDSERAALIADYLLPVVADLVREGQAEARPDVMHYPAYGCDWGDCDGDSPYLRWAPDLRTYLPVCEKHKTDSGRPT